MKTLTPKELQLMQLIWEMKKAFVKELIELLPNPKPHYNTVSTTIRILEEKGFVKHESFGQSHRYFPIVSKEEYQKKEMGNVLKNYFNSSYSSMLTYFAKEENISSEQFEEILRMIKNNEK